MTSVFDAHEAFATPHGHGAARDVVDAALASLPSFLSVADAFDLAVELARLGPPFGPNPRVGSLLLAPSPETNDRRPRRVLGAGFHQGAGTAHAEVAALRDAAQRGNDVRGATAVVTLEPCAHHGRTPPCASALIEAGVAEVRFAVADPNPEASGGAALLRSASIPARLQSHDAATELTRVWSMAVSRDRPYVTLKLATTLDGRIAAADGTSKWITGEAARRHAHGVRSTVDAIVIGTGTALADDPALTARDEAGALAAHQPLRVVVGMREVPAASKLRDAGGELLTLRTHDPADVASALAEREVRHLLVEGGPTLATAFLRSGLVDELHAYSAPVLLGSGPAAVGDLGITTIDAALRWQTVAVERLGDDVLTVARRVAAEPSTTATSPTALASADADDHASRNGTA